MLYSDATLSADCPGTYEPRSRSCGLGTDTAYSTVAAAATAAGPGDTVLLREGTYGEVLRPSRSGFPDRPILFSSYPGETAIFANVQGPALMLINVSHVIIDSLTVADSIGWARLENADHNIIRNSRFQRAGARGSTGGLKLVRSAYTRIHDNTFQDGNDSIVVQESDRNVIDGNTFTTARHSLLSIRCGSFNIVRRNRFQNVRQKALEIYDCEGVSDAPVKLDATKRNLVEANTFAYTRGSGQPHRYNGIQYAGQHGIVRRNVFQDNQGGALNFQVYSQEAIHNYGHRVYHNTFFANRCFAITASTSPAVSSYRNNVATNNLLYRNVDCNGGGTAQIDIGNPKAVVLRGNAMLATPPGFVDEDARDLRLTGQSSVIDGGVFLTQAVGGGSGTTIRVQDASYFVDGYGIPGESGDLIQLGGNDQTARIVAVDLATNTLTVDRPLTWHDRQGVHLAYAGAAPDIGAYEFGLETVTAPLMPRVPDP